MEFREVRRWQLWAVISILFVGCTYRPPKTITCDKLRMLQVGMTRQQVQTILGSDNGDDTSRFLNYSPPPTTLNVGGIRLFVEFREDGQLLKAASYAKYVWSSSNPTIFYVDSQNRIEGDLFKETYCP
jgi:hypothetical protein